MCLSSTPVLEGKERVRIYDTNTSDNCICIDINVCGWNLEI